MVAAVGVLGTVAVKQRELRELSLAELSGPGVDGADTAMEKEGVKDNTWHLGVGYLCFVVMGKIRRRSRCGLGVQKLHLRSTKRGLLVGIDSEPGYQCFSHFSACSPTEPLI